MPDPRVTRLPLLRLPCTTISPRPRRAVIAADDAYGSSCAGGRIVTPYSGRNLDNFKDSFNYYLSSLRITVEQVFGVIVPRWGILWSPLRCSLARATRMCLVCAKLHNYLIDQRIGRGDNLDFNDIPGPDLDNTVRGEPEIFLQNYLHLDGEVARHIRQCSGTLRDELANQLRILGLVRPARQVLTRFSFTNRFIMRRYNAM
jgi:DDE superfamily endonuclease